MREPTAPDPDLYVRVGDLVSLAQIAERAGVGDNAVANWTVRGNGPRTLPFPDPVRDEQRSRLWLWPEVAAWLDETGRTYTQ